MIFVAKNLDASENNLGTISIKSIDDVSQSTYDIISAYGNKVLSEDAIIALDDFLIDFNEKWSSKVNCLILPILCGEQKVYDTLQDLKTSPAILNIKTKESAQISSDIYSTTYGRLKVTDNGFEKELPNVRNFRVDFDDYDGMTNNNFHYILISNEWTTAYDEQNTISHIKSSGIRNYSLIAGEGNTDIIDTTKLIIGLSIKSANEVYGYNQNVKKGVTDTNPITRAGVVKSDGTDDATGFVSCISYGVGFDTQEDFDEYCDALYRLYNILKTD